MRKLVRQVDSRLDAILEIRKKHDFVGMELSDENSDRARSLEEMGMEIPEELRKTWDDETADEPPNFRIRMKREKYLRQLEYRKQKTEKASRQSQIDHNPTKNIKSNRRSAGFAWNPKLGDYKRNISQLLTNGMRMLADDLDIHFRSDGYVDAKDLIHKINQVLTKVPNYGSESVPILTEELLKTIIYDNEIQKNIPAQKEFQGMGERHQYMTESGTLYVRCMQGHLTKFYGNEQGQIQVNRIFQPLPEEVTEIYHDTKLSLTPIIDAEGLKPGERHLHFSMPKGIKSGRESSEVRYTVNVRNARIEGGVQFWVAPNDVVLATQTILPKFFKDSWKLLKAPSTKVSESYCPFYDPASNQDDLLIDFGRDLSKTTCPNLKTVLKLISTNLMNAAIKRKVEDTSFIASIQANIPAEKLRNSTQDILPYDLNIRFWWNQSYDIYMVMINGKSDEQLIQLGKLYGFPRGCPVLWKKSEYIDFRGFFPKFQNDKISMRETFTESQLTDCNSLYFFQKWSGFLLHVIAFITPDGEFKWTVCSKKVADPGSKYVQWGAQIISEYMKPALIKYLAENHFYMGGEALHVDDEHGYIAKENAVIITCIGKGSYSHFQHEINNDYVPGKLVDYKTSKEVLQFCKQFSLMCDTATEIHGNCTDISDFIKNLLKDRDLLTFTKFDEYSRQCKENPKYFQIFTQIPGSANHGILVGDTLEGFVFNLTKTDNSTITLKVKLPLYTWRTMFLRDVLIKYKLGNESTYDGDGIFVSKASEDLMKDFVDRWCVTHKEIFMMLMKCAAFKLQCEWQDVLNEIKPQRIENRVHVIVADSVENLLYSDQGLEKLKQYADRFDSLVQGYSLKEDVPITVCLVLGPIGSGKSTTMTRLKLIAEKENIPCEAIDGDDILINQDAFTTQQLSNERNAVTMSRMWEAIMEGKVPIISHGGGSFCKTFNKGGKETIVCNLKDRINDVFGSDSKIITLIMKDAQDPEGRMPSKNVSIIHHDDLSHTIDDMDVTDESYIKPIIDFRLDNGLWNKSPNESREDFISKIFKKSKHNSKFAAAISSISDIVATVPYKAVKTVDNMGEWRRFLFSIDGLQTVVKHFTRGFPRDGVFQALRAIMQPVDQKESDCKHVTLKHVDTGRGFYFSSAEVNLLRTRLCGPIDPQTRLCNKVYVCERSLLRMTPAQGTPGKKGKPDTKTISVCYVQDLQILLQPDKRAHITEQTSGFNPADSEKVLLFFENSIDKFTLTTMEKPQQEYIFSEFIDEKEIEIDHKNPVSGVVVRKEKKTIPSNYVRDEEVLYKCVGIAVYRFKDI